MTMADPEWEASSREVRRGDRQASGLLLRWEGAPPAAWARRWGIPRFEAWRALTSSNDRARELAAEDASLWSTVVAEEQTAGRGREGRSWSSPPGMGLWLSTLVPPGSGRGVLPLRAGLAAARAVEEVTGLGAGIKWPNDVLVEGHKVAGILCEGVGAGPVVVGVGIDVRQEARHFPPALRGRAGSLEALSGRPVSRADLAGALLRELRRLAGEGGGALGGDEREELGKRDLLAGRRVVLSTGHEGRAVGIAPDGALLLEYGGERHRSVAGSVVGIDPPLHPDGD